MDAASDPYARKYKGIWICFLILARALGGNYVMCGVFELYGDPSLKVDCLLSSCNCSEKLAGNQFETVLGACISLTQIETKMHRLSAQHVRQLLSF